MIHIDILTTPRLRLRVISPEVHSYILENCDNEKLQAFFGLATEADAEKEREKYRKGITTYKTSFRHFLLQDTDTENVIGWCGYHTWYPEHYRAEIGYHLSDDIYKRKGLMTEALNKILDYGFNEMQLRRVEALTALDNHASINILKKFGFQFEGVIRQHYNENGINTDSNMYSLLQHEFKPL